MPMTAAQTISADGTNVLYATPSSTETIQPTGTMILHVKNASGGSINVTITDAGVTPAGTSGTAKVIAVPAGQEREIYMNPNYVNASTGVTTVAFSATTSVTAAWKRV